MRLTIYTDFSLRVLMFLALKGDGLATIAEVAKGLWNLEEPPDEGDVSTRSCRIR